MSVTAAEAARASERIGVDHAIATDAGEIASDTPPHMDWSAVFAGALLALAFGFVMMSFGSGLGLSMAGPIGGDSG